MTAGLGALLPERVDLTYVAIGAAMGAVLVGVAARFGRDLGLAVDLQKAAATGAFWGGWLGFAYVVWDQIEG